MSYIFWTPEKFNVQVLHSRIFFGTTFFLPGIKCELPQKMGLFIGTPFILTMTKIAIQYLYVFIKH